MREPRTEDLLDETFAVISFITYLHTKGKLDLDEIIRVCEKLNEHKKV